MRKNLKHLLIIFFFSSNGYAEGLKKGNKYKTINPTYLIGEYKDRNNKIISKETATAYLESACRAEMSYTAFQKKVPIGTVMTIIGPAPKPWYLYFKSDRYFVKLISDFPQGLNVRIQLDRGLQGSLDGLNSELFQRIEDM